MSRFRFVSFDLWGVKKGQKPVFGFTHTLKRAQHFEHVCIRARGSSWFKFSKVERVDHSRRKGRTRRRWGDRWIRGTRGLHLAVFHAHIEEGTKMKWKKIFQFHIDKTRKGEEKPWRKNSMCEDSYMWSISSTVSLPSSSCPRLINLELVLLILVRLILVTLTFPIGMSIGRSIWGIIIPTNSTRLAILSKAAIKSITLLFYHSFLSQWDKLGLDISCG